MKNMKLITNKVNIMNNALRKQFDKILAVIVFICFYGSLYAQVLYTVDGYVFLEDSLDSGTHAGVKVKFYNLPSMEPEDSTTSQTDGRYSINISPGYYMVEWTKDGYVPWEMGGLALSGDTTLTNVTLIPGQVIEVAGDVSGNWTTGYVYYVTDNINIPAGDSLIIDAGVRVKFSSGTGMVCYGKLKANGTEDAHVLFTSREPTPLPGDWDNIELYAQNNVLTYVDYEWATDGIRGSSASYTTIDHLNMVGSLSLTANGLYFTGSTNLTFTNNKITVAGDYSIYAHDSHNSNISNNALGHTGSRAISAENSDSTNFSGNTINGNPGVGIYAPYSDNAKFLNNVITTSNNGIEAWSAGDHGVTISGNTITGFKDFGVNFNNSPNSTITDNVITSRTTTDWDMRGISGNSPNSLIAGNKVTIDYDGSDNSGYHYGIDCNQSIITGNTVYVEGGEWNYPAYGFGIRADNSTISGNIIDVNQTRYYSCFMYGIESNGTSVITDNTIRRLQWPIRAISTNGDTRITGNKIIYAGSAASNEQNAYTIYTGSNTLVNNNEITGMPYGINVQDDNDVVIDSNYIDVTQHGIYISKSSAEVTHNIIKTASGRGIFCENQAGNDFAKNTIIGGGDYGIYITNLSAPTVRNNIIQGFQNGIYAENDIQNYNLMHNDLWQIAGKLFVGSALPPLIGQMIDVNANGAPADIYNNINLDPQFVHPDTGNYHLQITSPCINAGDPNLNDPDGTVSDIGACPYFLFLVIDHTPLSSTNDTEGPYPVTARIYSPAGHTVSETALFYSTDGGNSYSELPMTNSVGDTFRADIPGQPMNTSVNYYIYASDGTLTLTDPFEPARNTHSFFITTFSQFANLNGSSDTDGSINLKWDLPVPISGNLVGLNLYKDNVPGVAINPAHLLVSLGDSVVSFLDEDVNEGDKYYYKLTGLVDDASDTMEVLASSEISVISDNPTIVRVKGVALLENSADHAEIKIFFEKTSPSAVSDSCYTGSDGGFDKILKTGIYNVHISKDGYQPVLIGDQFFPGNAVMDTVTLVPGGVVILSGDVSGTLTSNNIYFVDGNIVIPDGQTLTIEAGTQVLFRGNYSLTANGRLLVNGTPEKRVVFSSRMPVPAAGDWQNIILNSGADSSRIMYAVYKYAADGIQCNSVSPLTIHGLDISMLSINARGISLSDCHEIDICYNNIQVAGDWVIYKADYGDQNARYIGNTISGTNQGMRIPNSKNAICDSNTVTLGKCSGSGIYAYDSDAIKMRSNLITGDYIRYGFYLSYADNAIIYDNEVNLDNYTEWNSEKYGYYLRYCSGDSVLNNRYLVSGKSAYYYAFNLNGASRHYFENNYIKIEPGYGDRWNWSGFIYGSDHTFINNKIIINHINSSGAAAFFQVNNSLIRNCYIEITSRDSDNYWGTAISGNGNTLIGDTLILGYYTRGIHGSNLTIKDVVIQSPNANNLLPAIYSTGGVLDVHNVQIRKCYDGIYGTGSGGMIRNTLIDIYGDYGSRFEDNAAMTLYQNTLVGNNNGVGIESRTNATITVNSCIITGFTTGALAESPQNIQTSLFHNNQVDFSGAELPNQVGETITVNSNADPADIYGNIVMDPMFVDRSTENYSLRAASPAINAGDIDSLDVDGTIADIGAYPYNFGFVPQDVVIDSTGNGFVAVSWDIEPTDSLTGFQPYYKESSGSEWIKADPTTELNHIYTGLTNNVVYDFCVAAYYGDNESNQSRKTTARAGTAVLDVSPRYIIGIQSGEEPQILSFVLSNLGSKTLDFSLLSTAPAQDINGYTDKQTEGVEQDVTNEPNNDSNEDVGELNSDGSWNDCSIWTDRRFVLETESSQQHLSLQEGSIAPGGSVTIYDTLYAGSEYLTTGKIYIKTNNYKHPLDSVEVLNISGVVAPLEPAHFTPVATTDKLFYVVVNRADIDGILLQTGDEIAVFDGEICVGAAGYNGSFPFVFPVYGADDGVSGFTEGDSMTIKIWDSRHLQYANCQYAVQAGCVGFVTDGFTRIDISGTIYKTIQIPLAAQRFNLISTCLYPRYLQVETVFNGLAGLRIIYQDNGRAYIPEYNLNSIGDMDISEGYHIFIDGSDQILTIEGINVIPENWQILLKARQFNSVATLYDTPVDITQAFSEITNQIDIIQDDQGNVWIPSMGINSLGTLEPGRGYQVFTNAENDIAYYYPPASQVGIAKEVFAERQPVMKPEHFRFDETGLPYIVVIQSASYDQHPFEEGDEIGVFATDVCVGAGVWRKDEPLVIPAWKAYQEQKIPGYQPGDVIEIRGYSRRFNAEFSMAAKFADDRQKTFEGASYTVLSAGAFPELIPGKFALKQNYPNPFNATTLIPYDIPTESDVTFIVYNMLGEEVCRLIEKQHHLPGKYRILWAGRSDDGRQVASGIYFVRMISGDFHSIQKMILLK